eukprot:g6442.t1
MSSNAPPALPVPPLLPIPPIDTNDRDSPKPGVNSYDSTKKYNNRKMQHNSNNENNGIQYDNDRGVKIYPFGEQCLNAMNEYNNILKDNNTNTNAKKEAVHNIFKKLIDWIKKYHCSVGKSKELYKLKPSDIRLFFNLFRPKINADDISEIPRKYKILLLRAFRENLVCDQADMPRSYFHFSELRTGFLQLPEISHKDWENKRGYTFNIWLCPSVISETKNTSNDNNNTMPPGNKRRLSNINEENIEMVLYSFLTRDNNKGIECRLIRHGDGRTTVLEVRSKVAVKSKLTRAKKISISSPFQRSSPKHVATPTSATKVTKNEWNTVQFEVNIPFDGETWTMVTIVHVPSGATGNSGSKVNIRSSFIGSDKKPGTITCYVNGTLSHEKPLECPELLLNPTSTATNRTNSPTAGNAINYAEAFTNCSVGLGFCGKIERFTMYNDIVEESAIKLLYSSGIGFRYPPLSTRQPTPVSLSLSCNRTVYETSHALDVLWSYCAEDAMTINEHLKINGENRLVGEWRTQGRLTLSRVIQSDHVKDTRRYATMMGEVTACWGGGTWAQSSMFIAGGIKIILPLFANFNENNSKESGIDKVLSFDVEDEKNYDLHTETLLLLRGFIFGAGGLRLRKEIYETRAVAVVASLLNDSENCVITLSNELLSAIFLTTKTLINMESALANDFVRYLLLDFDLWSKADWNVQKQLINLLHGLAMEYPNLLRQVTSVQNILDQIRASYTIPSPSKHIIANPNEAATCAAKATELIEGIIMSSMILEDEESTANSPSFLKSLTVNLSAVLGYVRGCSGSLPGKHAAAAGLNILNRLLDDVENPRYYLKVYEAIQSQGGAAELVPLVGRPGEEARAFALGLMGRLLLLSRKLNDEGNNIIANANESKSELVLRLMSASLIELRGVEALQMMNCGGKTLWGDYVMDIINENEEVDEFKKEIEQQKKTSATVDKTNRSSKIHESIRSPYSRRKERIVSESTVAAATVFVCGKWETKDSMSIQKNSNYDSIQNNMEHVLIALPEGLLLLLGLLTAPSIPSTCVEDTVTKLSLWIKMNSTNATKILGCGHWQRWFLGLYLSLENRTDEGGDVSHTNVAQSMVADIISCLYAQLLLRVKNGYQQWRVTLKLLEYHPQRILILRQLLTLSFRRLYSELQQQFRADKKLSSAAVDNIIFTFQFVDQWILPNKSPEMENKSKNELNIELEVEERNKILGSICKIYDLLRSVGGIVQKRDGEVHQRAIPIIRLLTRLLPFTPKSSILSMLELLLNIVALDMPSSSYKSRQIVLKVIFALQETMLRNDDDNEISQRVSLAVLSIVNNRDLGNVVEGWEAEAVAGAMRPQTGESPETSAHRIFDLLTRAMIAEVSNGNETGNDYGNNNDKQKSLLSSHRSSRDGFKRQSALEYQSPDLFSVSKRKASIVVNRQVRLSTIDVTELQNRQNARSNLDQQRFVLFMKTMEVARSQTKGFFSKRIWPSLKMGYHTPWSCNHGIRRYFILDNAEEHLFSRRRRRLALDPFGDAHKEKSYALFARGGNQQIVSSRGANDEDVDKLLAKVSIKDAMSKDKIEANNKDENASGENDISIDDDSDDDGWAAEDNEWDEIAKEREVAARKAVRVRKTSKSKRRSSFLKARKTRTSSLDVETVLCRDDRVVMVRPSMSAAGSAILTNRAIIFNPDPNAANNNDDEQWGASNNTDADCKEEEGTSSNDKVKYNPANRKRRWRLENIRRMYLRRYCLVSCAFELFVSGGEVVFLVFKGDPQVKRRDTMYGALYDLLERRVQRFSQPLHLSPQRFFTQSGLTRAWQSRALSNFDYLMALNTMAGRSYTDLSQYPVFPWVLVDYKSDHIDLSDQNVYRDLSLPVGALNPKRLEEFRHRYETFDDDQIPKFLYGSHYSTSAGVVLYFLVRLEPFSQLHVETQDGHFDVPDRLFSSISKTWEMCYTSLSEVKELTPEFYSLPNFLRNESGCPLGTMQDGNEVNDVHLPPWANDSPEIFIDVMRHALESEYVSKHLHEWVDLIFGFKQRGEAAVEANNVFYYLTYEGTVNLDEIDDPTLRHAMQLQIEHFGQCPTQLLTAPHPPRGRTIRVPRPLYLTFLGQHSHFKRPNSFVGIADLAYINAYAPGVGSLVRLGFDPLRAIEALEKTDDLKLCANRLALGGEINKKSKFSDMSGTIYRKTGEGKPIVSVRCLFDSIECIDADGNVYSFPLERLDSRHAAENDKNNIIEKGNESINNLYGNDFIPMHVHSSETPMSSRYYTTTVPALSDGAGIVSKMPLKNNEMLSRATAWSSGGYIFATGGACHGSVEFWVIERTDEGAPFISGSLSINGHETTVTLVTISREVVLTGSNDGIVMLWHLSKDGNNNATISNRPYQILRGHTDAITSGSINKTCQTAVTTSGERLVLIHRIEEAPPNGQHELLGDLPLIEIKFDEMSFPSTLSSITVHNCIITAAGVIVCIVNLTTLVAYDINGLEIMRKEAKADHGNCQQIMVVERTSRGNVIVTGGGNTVCVWSARTLCLLHSYQLNTSGNGILTLSLSLSEEMLSVGCDDGLIVAICLPNFRDLSDPHAPQQKQLVNKLKARQRASNTIDTIMVLAVCFRPQVDEIPCEIPQLTGLQTKCGCGVFLSKCSMLMLKARMSISNFVSGSDSGIFTNAMDGLQTDAIEVRFKAMLERHERQIGGHRSLGIAAEQISGENGVLPDNVNESNRHTKGRSSKIASHFSKSEKERMLMFDTMQYGTTRNFKRFLFIHEAVYCETMTNSMEKRNSTMVNAKSVQNMKRLSEMAEWMGNFDDPNTEIPLEHEEVI